MNVLKNVLIWLGFGNRDNIFLARQYKRMVFNGDRSVTSGMKSAYLQYRRHPMVRHYKWDAKLINF